MFNVIRRGRILKNGIKSLSVLDKLVLATGSALVGFVDPSRGDMISLLGETTGRRALINIRDKMRQTEEGQRILRERPRIRTSEESFKTLNECAEGTFGAEYLRYIGDHAFSPDERHEVQFIDDPELAYVMTRYREVHDFWHVLADLPPSVVGETALKYLECLQTGLPVAALSALVAPMRLSEEEKELFYRIYVPWAVETGKDSVHLMSVPYEDLFNTPIDEVRQKLRFGKAPRM